MNQGDDLKALGTLLGVWAGAVVFVLVCFALGQLLAGNFHP